MVLRRVHAVTHAGGRVPRPQQTHRHACMTEAGGMAAEEVEQLITFPLETTMGGMPGRGVHPLGVQRRPVLRLRHLRLENRHLPRPPDGGRAPASRSCASNCPRAWSMWAWVRSAPSWARSCCWLLPIDTAKISPMAVREYADFVMRPRLLTLPGVAQVVPIGGEVRQYQVQPDTVRMAALGITHEKHRRGAQGLLVQHLAAAFLELNGREYLIRNHGPHVQSRRSAEPGLECFRNGQPILLRQVAEGHIRARHQARRRRLRTASPP
jgi:HME family heavy-metal exporter